MNELELELLSFMEKMYKLRDALDEKYEEELKWATTARHPHDVSWHKRAAMNIYNYNKKLTKIHQWLAEALEALYKIDSHPNLELDERMSEKEVKALMDKAFNEWYHDFQLIKN